MSCIALLKDLIAIPSVNPMGRDLDGPEFLESRMSDYLERWFAELGVDHHRTEVAPRRSNVTAHWTGSPDRPTVLLEAHQDTVPVDGMSIPPFDPTERSGRIYGRGSCDVKGGMAAMLAAFARVVRERPAMCGDVVMSCTCDEEQGQLGVLHLTEQWKTPHKPEPGWLHQRPDMAIIAEPTSLDVVVAHRGVTRWKLRTHGKPAHSSKPSEGINAIYRMASVIRHLQEYAEHLEQHSDPHPLCGPPTLSVGRITGGISVNVVAPECTIEIDRRVIPGEDQSQIVPQVSDWLKDRLDFECDMDAPWIVAGPLGDDLNGPLADRVLGQTQNVVGPRSKIGVAYGTDAACISAAGVPAVVFGPGSIEQAHTQDEWIETAQVQQAEEIIYRFLTDATV